MKQNNLSFITFLKIVFEGIKGITYFGDIAIDDAVVSSGTCSCKTFIFMILLLSLHHMYQQIMRLKFKKNQFKVFSGYV